MEPDTTTPEPIEINIGTLHHCAMMAIIYKANLCYICHLWLIWERKCYICPELDFQCEFNGDVCLVIGLTKYGNFSKFICSGTVFQADFNYDSHYVIRRVYCNNI